jgi:hypothetical protein
VLAQAAGTRALVVPYWNRANIWQQLDFRRDGPVWVTTSAQSAQWAQAVRQAIITLWPAEPAPVLLLPADDPSACTDDDVENEVPALDRALRLRQLPRCVVDAASGLTTHSVLRETLQRAGVPWIMACRVAGPSFVYEAPAQAGEPRTLGELLQQVADAVQGGRSAVSQAEQAYANDAGWQQVWKQASARLALF